MIYEIKPLLKSIRAEFIERYNNKPEFSDIENDYNIIIEIIDEFFCEAEVLEDVLYIKKRNSCNNFFDKYCNLIENMLGEDTLFVLGTIEDILDNKYDGSTYLRDMLCIFDVLVSFIVYSEELIVEKNKEIESEER